MYIYIYIYIIIYTRHVIKQSTVHYDILRLSMSVQGISNIQLLYIIKPDILRPYGGFLSHGGCPNVSYHPYGFSQKINPPAIGHPISGVAPVEEPPDLHLVPLSASAKGGGASGDVSNRKCLVW